MDRCNVQVSRRAMLAGGIATLALTGCGSGAPLLGPGMSGPGKTSSNSAPPLHNAEAAAWIAAAGTIFYAGGHRMRLAGIEPVGPAGGRPEGLRQQGFTAAFDLLDGAAMIGDQIYTISHTSIPTFDIFLNNSASTPSRMIASFN